MSNVFIIGNGFDLNLGLKTGYKDFVSSEFFLKNVGIGNLLFDYLHQINQDSNWIDIEMELQIYSKKNPANNSFLKEYKILCGALKNHIKSIDISQMDTSSEAYKLFSSNDLGRDFTIINFNYTNSVLHILSSLYSESDYRLNILHVHGSIEMDEIVFGVDDKANISEKHTFLYKSTSSIYNGSRCIEALDSFEKLHVFGHSLGESDHMYLDFFNPLSIGQKKSRKKINIYHYGEDAKHDIYKQLHKLTHHRVSILKNNTIFQDIDLNNFSH